MSDDTLPLRAAGQTPRCLNCQASLNGPFCASCGQRAVPPNPTVHELIGDAWGDLTGYDGRIAHTVRALFHPGRLTRGYIAGQRARYVSPVRLYLTASVVYFVVAAAAPNLEPRSANEINAAGLRIEVPRTAADQDRPLEDDAERVPAFMRSFVRAVTEEPEAFRRRSLETMPRVFFAMLPVFAGITALFFRRRPFPMHLTFATHLHAFAFVVLSVSEASKLSRLPVLAGIVGALAGVVVVVYALRAFRAVYQERWGRTMAKAAGIAMLYFLSSIPAFILMLAWVTVSR